MIILLLFYIFLIILTLFTFVLSYFFVFGFVRRNLGNIDDMDDIINKPLQEYKEEIQRGMNYIDNKPHSRHTIKSYDRLNLSARYFDNSSDKTVILFHGYRSSAKRDFSCAVKMYSDFGFNVLLCDQRSHGESEGKIITFGIKESEDVLSWCNYAVSKLGAKEILLGGMSMGATTVLLASNKNLPENVKGMVADCGFSSPVGIIKNVAKNMFKLNPSFLLPFINLFCLVFGKFSIYGHSTVQAAKESELPILFIHGKSDNFVPCNMSIEAYEIKKENRKLLIVDNAAHGVSYLVDRIKVENAVKEFISNIF